MSEDFDAVAAMAIARDFAAGRSPDRLVRLGSGHIHLTLRACFRDDAHDLVLQRLNEHVFPDLDAVMQNLRLVTEHLQRLAGTGPGVSEIVASQAGPGLVRDAAGAAWRAFRFARGTCSHDVVVNDRTARAAAHAFGAFAAELTDLDPGVLAVPIPHFHDLGSRIAQLRDAVQRDAEGRLGRVRGDVDGVLELAASVERALERGGADELPPRVVHNDCKINNLLFDERSGAVRLVVDLDTVMPGSLLVDFGELVRTAAFAASEDEPDLARIELSLSRFAALAEGYRAGLAGSASAQELALLWLGGPWMAVENAARFLADHLDGDRYFRTGDNRARARAQLHRARLFWNQRAALREGLERVARPA